MSQIKISIICEFNIQNLRNPRNLWFQIFFISLRLCLAST